MQQDHLETYLQYDEIDLIAEAETDFATHRDTDNQKQRLKNQNKMKQKALNKASALIDLLNVELAVSKNAFEQAVQELKEQLQAKQQQQFKLRQSIKNLEHRNEFLESQCRRRIVDTRLSQSTSKSSFKSRGISPSQQVTRISSKTRNNSVSPSVNKSKKKQQNNQLSVEYMKTFLDQFFNQDYEQNQYLNNFIQRENTKCQNKIFNLSENNNHYQFIKNLKGGIPQEIEEQFINKIQMLKNIIYEQTQIIKNMRIVCQQYKNIFNQLINNLKEDPSNNTQSDIINSLIDMNDLFLTKSREVKDRICLSSSNLKDVNSYQLKIQSQKIQAMNKFSEQIKIILNINNITNQEDMAYRIKQLKKNQMRLIQQNKQLISITEGLVKYIRY